MTKRKTFLAVLILLLITCITLGVMPFINSSNNTAEAATTYNLQHKGSAIESIYSNHWGTGRTSRSYGESSGIWTFGYTNASEISGATSTTIGTYNFHDTTTYAENGYDDGACEYWWGQRIYVQSTYRSVLQWTAEDYGTVRFTGAIVKTSRDDFGVFAQEQNGLSAPVDFGTYNTAETAYDWTGNYTYYISVWKISSYGMVTKYEPFCKTYSSEFAYLVPQYDFEVYPGDKIAFSYGFNDGSYGSDTGAFCIIDAQFTEKVDQTALDKATIMASNKITSFYAISDTHMSGADAKYLPTILNDMNAIDKDASAILNLGDLTDLGVSTTSGDQLTAYYNQLKSNYLTNSLGQKVPYLNVIGNHDVRGDINVNDKNEDYYGNAMSKYLSLEGVATRNWVKTVGGIRIIGLNTCQYEWDDTTLSAEDLVWLDKQLSEGEEDGSGRPQIIMIHANDDLGQVRSQGSVTFRQVIEKHPSAIVMSGHTHDAFGTATVTKTESGAHFVNMPGLNWNIALSTSWDANYGLAWSYSGNTPTLQYYYIEVYEKGIIFRGRECNVGTWMTEGDLAILTNVSTEDYEQSVQSSMVAWYQFDTVETAHIDATGNYNLTNLNNGTLATDGIILPTNSVDDPLVYANSASQHPFTYFSAGSKWTISMLYYTGSYNSDWDRILANNSSWSGYFSLQHTPGKIRVVLSSGSEIVFGVEDHAWVRLITWYDGANVNATLFDVTNNANITADGNSYVTIASYDLNTGIGGFTIGNKGDYSGTGGNGAATEVADRKIADLRIYAGQIGNDEVARIRRGDLGYRSEANLQFSYRPFSNGQVEKDSTGYNSLASIGASFDADTGSAVFDQNEYPIVNYKPYYNAKNGNNVANDFSDYMRKSKFSVSFRAFMTSAYIDGSNYTYYLFTTGKYSNSFTIAADGNRVLIYLGRGVQGGEGGDTCVYLHYSDILSVNPSGQWIRGTVTYDGVTFSGELYNESNKQTYTSSLYDAGGAVVSNGQFIGGAFGGYGYSVAFGAQTTDGKSSVAQTTYNATGSGRKNVKVSRLDVYSGVLTGSQIAELNALDDKVAGEFKTNSDSCEKVAHYQFLNANALGYDTQGKFNLTNAGGIVVDSVNGGIILNSNGTASNSYLYAQNILGNKGVDLFDKYRGSMSISLRAKIKATQGNAYTILGSGVNGKGMYVAVKDNGLVVQSGSSVLTFGDIFTSSLEWYRLTIIFDYTSQTVSVTAARQIDNTYVDKGTQTRTVTDVGFGGSFYQTFTVGGVANSNGVGLLAYSTDGDYNITLSDLVIYSGVINATEIASIDALDAKNILLDNVNSKINAQLDKDLSLNYWLKTNGGTLKSITATFNGHLYENLAVIEKEVSLNSGNYYWYVQVSGMAPQDMNDKIVIQSAKVDYLGKEYSLNLNNWKWVSTSLQDYLTSVVTDFGDNTKEGKMAIYALNYGAEAQKILPHDVQNLANAQLSSSQQQMTEWNDSLVLEGGVVYANSVKGIIEAEGNASLELLKGFSIAPRYDNRLGFGIFVAFANDDVDFTVQITDVNGDLIEQFSKAEADKISGNSRYLLQTDGVVDISNLTKEFRIKVFVNGEQQYHTYRYNFMSVINNSWDNAKEGNLVKCIYSLYALSIA